MFKPNQETTVTSINKLMKDAFKAGMPANLIETIVTGFEDKDNLLPRLVETQVELIEQGHMPTVLTLESAVAETYPNVIENRRVAIVNELVTFINKLYSGATKPGFLVLNYLTGFSVSAIEKFVTGPAVSRYILDDAQLKGFDEGVMTPRIEQTVSMLGEVLQDTINHQFRNDLFEGSSVPDFIATRAFNVVNGDGTEPLNDNLREYMTDFFLNFSHDVYRQLLKERRKFMETQTAPVRKPKPAPKYTQYLTLGVEEQKKLHSFLGHNSPDALVIAQREDGSIDFLVNYDLED